MNTATAAQTAGVTVDTIRYWCRYGAIAATKQAGRWVIDAASLTHRIALRTIRARRQKTMDITPLTRSDFEAAVTALGFKEIVPDQRCYREYRSYQHTGSPYLDDEYNWSMIRRGAALAAEGYTPPAPKPIPYECHTCGLDARTCDCI